MNKGLNLFRRITLELNCSIQANYFCNLFLNFLKLQSLGCVKVLLTVCLGWPPSWPERWAEWRTSPAEGVCTAHLRKKTTIQIIKTPSNKTQSLYPYAHMQANSVPPLSMVSNSFSSPVILGMRVHCSLTLLHTAYTWNTHHVYTEAVI